MRGSVAQSLGLGLESSRKHLQLVKQSRKKESPSLKTTRKHNKNQHKNGRILQIHSRLSDIKPRIWQNELFLQRKTPLQHRLLDQRKQLSLQDHHALQPHISQRSHHHRHRQPQLHSWLSRNRGLRMILIFSLQQANKAIRQSMHLILLVLPL